MMITFPVHTVFMTLTCFYGHRGVELLFFPLSVSDASQPSIKKDVKCFRPMHVKGQMHMHTIKDV